MTISLSKEDRDTIEDGIGDTMSLIHDARAVFDFLATGLVSGYFGGDDAAFASILRLSARAMKSAEANEIKALDLLDLHLRRARVYETGGTTA